MKSDERERLMMLWMIRRRWTGAVDLVVVVLVGIVVVVAVAVVVVVVVMIALLFVEVIVGERVEMWEKENYFGIRESWSLRKKKRRRRRRRKTTVNMRVTARSRKGRKVMVPR